MRFVELLYNHYSISGFTADWQAVKKFFYEIDKVIY